MSKLIPAVVIVGLIAAMVSMKRPEAKQVVPEVQAGPVEELLVPGNLRPREIQEWNEYRFRELTGRLETLEKAIIPAQ